MAIIGITYADKSDINTTATPNVNKVSASDMNEIKSVVNTNAIRLGNISNLTTSSKNNLVSALNEAITYNAWKLVGNTTGSTSLNLPATFREILAIVKVADNDNVAFSILIPQNILTSSQQGFNGGYIQSGVGTSSACRVMATTTTISLGVAYLNGTNTLTSSTMEVYYR